MIKTRYGLNTYNNLIIYLKWARDRLSCASSSQEESTKIIEEIYSRCKHDIDILYQYKFKPKCYDIIIGLISECEGYMRNYRIISTKERIKKVGELKTTDSPEDILNYIVYCVRNKIMRDYFDEQSISAEPSEEIFHEIDLSNNCKSASEMVLEECKRHNIKCEIIRIDPAFNAKRALFGGSGYHFFNIITIYGKRYLLDLTYSQYFYQYNNNLSRLGIMNLTLCAPGVYMLMNEARKKDAETIIQNGWIEFNDESIKHYFDGFALSVRNGLYYELHRQADYTTNFTTDDYLNFLAGIDDMFLREPQEGLGRQLRPLNNPCFKFKEQKR